jgi:acyl carrier protein
VPADPDTLQRVTAMLAEVCAVPVDTIRPDAPLGAHGLDSVRAFELVVLIEDAWGRSIPVEDLEDLARGTVAELADFVADLQ